MNLGELNLLNSGLDIEGQIDFWLQIFLLVVMIFYTIFAFLVSKQIGILNNTIKTPRAVVLRRFALGHLTGSMVILVLTLLFLIF